jgi:hypothetical protein
MIWISREALLFLSGPWLKGVGGGLFIAPISKEPLGRVFIGLVWWDTQGSSNLLLRTRIQGLDPREREREEIKLWISRRVLLF